MQASRTPKTQKLSLVPLWNAHIGYVGIIYHPMLRFAQVVKAHPELHDRLSATADRFIAAAVESYAELESSFHDGAKVGEGRYYGCERGGAAPYDNVGCPFNFLGKLASSELLLHQLTGKPLYRDHVTKIATLFKNRLTTDKGDAYVWDYWYEPITTGWTKADSISLNVPSHGAWHSVEDSSHGALEVEMAVNCAGAGVVFTADDLKRFANTFAKNVVNADRTGFKGRVDGSDPKSRLFDTRVAGWLPLASADPRVFDLARQVYLNRGKEDLPSAARLLKLQNAHQRP